MRIVQKVISILLVLQLLFSFGLCGGLCCVTAAKLPEPKTIEQHLQTAEQVEAVPHCHAKKAATAKSTVQHQTIQIHQTTARHRANIVASVRNRTCCAMKNEAPDSELSPTTIAPQTGKLIVEPQNSSWPDSLETFTCSPNPITFFSAHSPPHNGFQLSLRI